MLASTTTTNPIWMPGGDELAYLGPLWALVATVVAVLLGALAVGRNWRVSAGIATFGGLLTAWLAYRGFSQAGFTNWAGMTPSAPAAPMLVADQFSYCFIFLISVFMVLVTGMWWLGQNAGLPEHLTRKQDSTEFFVLFVGSAFGMSLMVSTTNLLMIILAVEMASLPSYGITAFRKKHNLAAEASLKYVLFGAITSAIMIYGASLLYGQYHTLDLAAIGRQIAAETGQSGPTVLMGVSLVAFMSGIAFKVSAVPFHFWCPDVFEGASIEITTWLSVASKAAGLGLMLRVIAVLTCNLSSPDTLEYVSLAIAVMAAITCTWGNISAFRQTNLKRLLAFSSIAHAGYMLMAVAIIWHPEFGQTDMPAHPSFSALVFYITVYLMMNLGAFGVIALVYWSTGKETIDAFNGLARRSLPLTIAMVVFLFSLVGLPPMGGFFAKWWLLYALWEGNVVWLILVAVFNTLISLYYYARIARAMIFTDDGQPTVHAPISGQAAVTVCAILVLLTGTLSAGWLKDFSDNRSRGLYAIVRPVNQEPTANDQLDNDGSEEKIAEFSPDGGSEFE
ncbi:MAG: NADH-quinone oxidoreductase subunit N [Phycisphaerales bacterium]|nr:NADH-quinone oxidoreductase subunit N [Phycisphaerales bacterium]